MKHLKQPLKESVFLKIENKVEAAVVHIKPLAASGL
jgi:hypothetical protein